MPRRAETPGAAPLYRVKIPNEEQGWTSRRAAVEIIAGDVAQADGTALRLRQIVDRRGDLYVKQLSDPATESVIEHVKKPLSSHQGHGTAKRGAYRRRGARRS
jgi:hypothetical protein